MRHAHKLLWIAAAALACGSSSTSPVATTAETPATPAGSTNPPATPAGVVVLANPNPSQPATVGTAFAYDATAGGTTFRDNRGSGLTYTVSLSPVGSGLSVANGRVMGTPATPGLVTVVITATDAGQATASDTFDIISFASGLSAPLLDASFRYSDADGNVPGHFTNGNGGPGGLVSTQDNTPATNPITNAGAALGRALFYDPRLSGNDLVSCASCHQQSSGFADTARLSTGFRGGLTGRHSMALTNARYYGRGRFFWDERAATLEDQVLRPIQDTVEMGMTLDQLEKKLALTDYYPVLFSAAFGTPMITRDRISLALAQFVRSLVSGRSRFDQAAAAGPTAFATVLTAIEDRGRDVFAQVGCARCHATFAQLADDTHNTGLDFAVTDVGAGNGRFKSPSLRNVGVRGRFMHDGRFSSLAEVVEFYDNGVRNNPNLDQRLRGPGGQPQRLNLSADDKAALVAFLNTLTDPTFLTDTRFSNPFPR
ncbi:MAG: cytochrome c peroxidase [Gemmatimonadota bacterium]|nr:cytochrome c peroxidase [Gemmatimonadota bacterium]